MKVECREAEDLLGLYVDNSLSEAQLAIVRSHLNTCEACALQALEVEFTISLCRSFPELEPPPHLIKQVLQHTTSPQQTLSWMEYLMELIRPLYASPRFATGACVAALSLSIVMNALGLEFNQIRWRDLTPRNVVDSLNRSVNVAYDNGLRRLNDLKILYQIQSKIEELRGSNETETKEKTEPETKPKERSHQNLMTERLIAVKASSPRHLKLRSRLDS